MINYLLVLALMGAQSGARDVTVIADQMANATKYTATFDRGRVSRCEIGATSGNPQVDMYVCKAVQTCGNKYHSEAGMTPCMVQKRKDLAGQIAKQLSQTK